MQFGKIRMFFYFNGIIALFLLLYFSPWLSSRVTIARVITPYEEPLYNCNMRITVSYILDRICGMTFHSIKDLFASDI